MKKTLALLLAVAMVLSLFAGCGEKKPVETEAPQAETTVPATEEALVVETFEGDFTYTDWVSTLSANWNPHTYETNDQSYPIDYLTAGLYNFIFNDELNPVEGKEPYQGYVIVPEMAAAMPQDVTAEVAAAHPEFNLPADATQGYAYIIELNPLATWEDGTPITADDYIESMKRLLDPKLQNYRSADYWEQDFCIAGAESYVNQGMTVVLDNGVTAAYQIADLVKNEDGTYSTPDGGEVYIAVRYPISWCSGNSLGDYVDAYADGYFGMDTWADLDALCDEQGLVRLTDEALALLTPVTTTNPNWGETDADLPNYLVYNKTYPEFDFANVGLYKNDDYSMTLVLGKALSGFTLLYNLSGNWLVKTDLYDECLTENGGVYTSTYNTSVETTVSYGPYKMTSYQTDKGMHFEKNENWYGYTDGKHIYKDPADGKIYPMFQTTAIDCQVVGEAATAKMMFLKGELMSYGLQTEDYATYRNSEFCHFTPGQATFFLILNGHVEAIKEREAADDFDQATQDLETITLNSFHRAMGLCFDKALYCDTLRPAQSPGFGLISDAYIYDAFTGASYRGTAQAKQVLCDVYGVDASEYASLDDAVASITGFDPVAAKEWFQVAFDEAMAAGFITDADADGVSDQAITLTYSASSVSDNLTKMLDYLTQKCAEVTEGTPFAGKISFVASAPLGNAWSENLKGGLTDTCLAGWTGSALNPFSLSDLYCNPSRAFDGKWFDGNNVQATFEINGEEITMSLKQWSDALNGAEVEVNGVVYNYGEGFADADTRLSILADIEREILLTYNYLPFSVDGSMALLTQKAFYVVEDYNSVMGRGGITYLRYNYNDAEWAEYVASCGGELTY